ncbi:MAG: FHA domain-containing protein [Cyanobacteria bacterium P01_C01_bin.72]
MITCPSCNHQNPEGSLQCENCYTPLPATAGCPNCGASVQTDATFCGQCGFNLQAESRSTPSLEETGIAPVPNLSSLEEIPFPDEIPLAAGNPEIMPETSVYSPIQSPWDEPEPNEPELKEPAIAPVSELPSDFPEVELTGGSDLTAAPETDFAEVTPEGSNDDVTPSPTDIPDLEPVTPEVESLAHEVIPQSEAQSVVSEFDPEPAVSEVPSVVNQAMAGATQLQVQKASLLHLQSNTTIEIPSNLNVVHFGKPNAQIPPDIDVSGFPDSEIVSRIHADIRIEGDVYYVEDTGSSNGTYVNHAPLQKGNRHRLRTGDRLALGKGDLVTFIFQLS